MKFCGGSKIEIFAMGHSSSNLYHMSCSISQRQGCTALQGKYINETLSCQERKMTYQRIAAASSKASSPNFIQDPEIFSSSNADE